MVQNGPNSVPENVSEFVLKYRQDDLPKDLPKDWFFYYSRTFMKKVQRRFP